MTVVRFTRMHEFGAELQRCASAGLVDGRIVRVTGLGVSWPGACEVEALWLVSTFVAGGQLVRLDLPCGELRRGVPDDAMPNRDTRQSYSAYRGGLVRRCEEAGVELLAGLIETAPIAAGALP